MSEGQLGSYAKSGLGGSSRGSSWRERRQKRHEDRRYEQEGEHSGPREGPFQTHQIMSGASGHERPNRRDKELECLWRLVRELELEARGRS